MNNPEYILTDEMATVVAAVKTALSLSVLNYQYGYVKELNETLKQWEQDPLKFDKKFPLVWLQEPFIVTRGQKNFYGISDTNLFIIKNTTKEWKAAERMTNNYLPELFPIYRELINQIIISEAFENETAEDFPHTITKGYYWGEDQKLVLNDAVDCIRIGGLKLRIKNNINCTILKTF